MSTNLGINHNSNQYLDDEKDLVLEKKESDLHGTHIAEVHYYTTKNGVRITVGDTPKEVKAVAVEVDDVNEPCETFRAYVIGTILAAVGIGE